MSYTWKVDPKPYEDSVAISLHSNGGHRLVQWSQHEMTGSYWSVFMADGSFLACNSESTRSLTTGEAVVWANQQLAPQRAPAVLQKSTTPTSGPRRTYRRRW